MALGGCPKRFATCNWMNYLWIVWDPIQKFNAVVAPLVVDGLPNAGTFTTADGATASGPVSWSGAGTPGSLIELYANGEKIGETFVNPDGKWSFEDVEMDLNLGNNLLSVRMLDGDGNVIGTSVTDTLLLRADTSFRFC